MLLVTDSIASYRLLPFFYRSLFVLAKVIANLNKVHTAAARAKGRGRRGKSSKQKDVVPYRESALTKLLIDSLGGTAMCVMLACVSPSEGQLQETMSTMQVYIVLYTYCRLQHIVLHIRDDIHHAGILSTR
jgi:hypothetical protein